METTYKMETHNNTFTSLSEAYEDLKTRGYINKFEMDDQKDLLVNSENLEYKSDEVKITEYHRFEGQSNPSDMSVIYAVETKDGKKGTIIDNYGADASRRLGVFLKKVKDISK